MDGISNTVRPLGTYQPFDQYCAVQIGASRSPSSLSGAGEETKPPALLYRRLAHSASGGGQPWHEPDHTCLPECLTCSGLQSPARPVPVPRELDAVYWRPGPEAAGSCSRVESIGAAGKPAVAKHCASPATKRGRRSGEGRDTFGPCRASGRTKSQSVSHAGVL